MGEMKWPIVTEENGPRPAGPSDECFYCRNKLGEKHEYDCVLVKKGVNYVVTLKLPDGQEFKGKWIANDPYSWEKGMCDFHKNESSWCSDNVMDDIVWDDSSAAKVMQDYMDLHECCSCQLLHFDMVGAIKPNYVDVPSRGRKLW